MAGIFPARKFMTALVFVDSNVLIYAIDEGNPKKHEAAKLWRAGLWKSRRGRVSFQVLQEFYANVTRKWPPARDQVQAEIRSLFSWHRLLSMPKFSRVDGSFRSATKSRSGIR